MSLPLASAILRGVWLLDPVTARTQLPILMGVLKGQMKFDSLSEEEIKALEPFNHQSSATVQGALSSGGAGVTQQKTIRVIPLSGVMMKNSEPCGPVGTSRIASYIQEADNDKAIDAIVLKIDSPGGMVDGTQTLADAISNCTKPVVGFIDDGICASAAYWAASRCKEIIASHDTVTVGSIGVYVTLADYKGYFEKEGMKIHEIYADQSSEKNRNFREAMKGNYKPIKENSLNQIAETFIASIQESRKGKLNASTGDPFKGDTYKASRAIELGLIDGIGSFQSAIDRAAELSTTTNTARATEAPTAEVPETQIQSDNSDMKIKVLSTQKHLAAVLGVTFKEGETEAEVEITPENLQAIEANMEQSATDLQKERDEVARLGKQAGSMGAGATTEKEKEASSSEKKAETFTTAADEELAKLQAQVNGKEGK